MNNNWRGKGSCAFKRWARRRNWLDKSVNAQTRAVDWWAARRSDFDAREFRMGWDEAEDAATEA